MIRDLTKSDPKQRPSISCIVESYLLNHFVDQNINKFVSLSEGSTETFTQLLNRQENRNLAQQMLIEIILQGNFIQQTIFEMLIESLTDYEKPKNEIRNGPEMMQKHSEMFVDLKKLGEGSFSSLYAVRDQRDSKQYALKKIKVENNQLLKLIERELKANTINSHPYIMDCYSTWIEVFGEGAIVYFQTQFFSENLQQWIQRRNEKLINCNEESEVYAINDSLFFAQLTLVKQLLRGIEFLHHKSLIHGDIKPSNILINEDKSLVLISDFAHKKVIRVAYKGNKFDSDEAPYAPPEHSVCDPVEYNSSVDIFSLGLVFYMFLLYPYFASLSPNDASISSINNNILLCI